MGAVHAASIPAISNATIIDSPTDTRDNNLLRLEAHVAKFPDSNPTPLRPASAAGNAKND